MPNILIHGNPVDGFQFIGPFPDGEEISEYHTEPLDEWWIGSLEAPLGSHGRPVEDTRKGLVLNRSTNGAWDGTYDVIVERLFRDLLSDGTPVQIDWTDSCNVTVTDVVARIQDDAVLVTTTGSVIEIDDVCGIHIPA